MASLWVVVDWSNHDVLVAFKKKPSQKRLQRYFDIDPKDFDGPTPIDEMDLVRVDIAK